MRRTRNPANAAYFSDLRALLTELGFQTTRGFLATAGDGFQSQVYLAAEFGTSTQCLALASRFPITRTVQIGRGAEEKKEFTRFPLFVQVDVPGTPNDVTVVVMHLKQGATQADEFRRGLEGLRVRQFLEAEGINGADEHLFLVGDFNEEINEPQTLEFSTAGRTGGSTFPDGSSLPATFQLGAGVPATLVYRTFPGSAFTPLGLSIVPATQTDGATDRTFGVAGDSRLDYLLAGDFTRSAGTIRAEVYNSGREPVGDGLPKERTLPAPGLSLVPTDHFALVADVALDPVPELSVVMPPGPFTISFAPVTPPPGVVSIPAPLGTPLEVTIAPFRDAPVQPIAPILIPAGQTSAPVPITIQGTPFGSERRITLVASAPGYRDGLGIIPTRRTGVSGEVIISQYTETPSGSAPKAIEILNVCSRDLVLATEPLRVLSYGNGASIPTTDALVEIGRLPRGAVLVIGDNETGAYLATQGILVGATASAIRNAAAGTVFTADGTPTGRAVFVKDSFIFNGDDALELQLNFARADVFGQPGSDPGTAWTTGGAPTVSTTNQNLSRRAAALAPSAGWTSPGLYFEVTGTTLVNALSGFGVAPELTDPYLAWTNARGLSGSAAGPTADPDGNGRNNFEEFVFGPAPANVSYVAGQVDIRLTVRNQLGNVRWGTEESADGRTWRKTSESTSLLTPPGGEFSPLVLTLPVTDPQRLVRMFVEKP